MTFLNLFMLFGTAAASIPLIIHLLNRSKYEIVNWGAMHLLDAVIEENNRRIRFYELLLLLIRCLIPIILALCLARPLVNQFAIGGLDSSIATIVVLDDSLSMAKQDETGQSRFEIAKNEIESLAKRLGDQTPLRIIPTNATSKTLNAPLAGDFSIEQAIVAALDIAAKDRNVPHEILVISDFQASGMSGFSEQAISAINKSREEIAKPPTISFLPVSMTSSLNDANIRVANVQVDANRVLVKQPFVIQAEIVNDRDLDLQNVVIDLLENDFVVASQTIQLIGNATRQIEFQHQINATEPTEQISLMDRLMTVRTRMQDARLVDDSLSTVLTPIRPTRVAVVSHPGLDPEDGGRGGDNGRVAEFVAVALSPFAFAGDGITQRDVIETVRIPGQKIMLEDLSDFDVLVLVDPGRLNDDLLQRITQFIEKGGGLLVFAGPRMEQNLAWMNESLGAKGAQWFDFRIEATSEPEAIYETSVRTIDLQVSRLEHPSMVFFNETVNGNLSDAAFSDWLVASDLGERSLSVVSFSNGQPMALETSLGNGSTIFCTTTADTTWNNLPLRPEYLPMMQRWIEYLVLKNIPPSQGLTGKPAAVLLEGSLDLQNVNITSPDGRQLDFTVSTPETGENLVRRKIQWSDTRAAGVYQIKQGEEFSKFYVADGSPDEWTSTPIANPDFARLTEQMQAKLVTTIDHYFELRTERAVGFEIWRWIWWCVLVLMVAERIIVWLIGRIS